MDFIYSKLRRSPSNSNGQVGGGIQRRSSNESSATVNSWSKDPGNAGSTPGTSRQNPMAALAQQVSIEKYLEK